MRKAERPVGGTDDVGTAVLDVAAADGLEAVTLENVAAALGVEAAELATRLSTEDDLWGAAGAVLEHRIVTLWEAVLAQAGPAERLAALLRQQVHEAAVSPVLGELLLGKLFASANPVIVAVLEDIRSRFTALVAQAVREGIAAGTIVTVDGDEMAHQVRVLLQGWVARWRLGLVGPDLERAVEPDLEALIASLSVSGTAA